MGRGWKVTKRRYQVWEDAGWADPIGFLLKAGQGDQLPSGVGRDGRDEEFDRGEFFLNWLRWIFAEIGFYKKHTDGSFLGAMERVQEAWSKFGQAKNLCQCFINKLPWYCCQLSAMGTCRLPLPRLNHVLLQLLNFIPLGGVKRGEQIWGIQCLGKNWQDSLSDNQIFSAADS